MKAFIPPLIAWFSLIHSPDTVCYETKEFTISFSGILATFTISFVLELWTIVCGFRGTPLNGNGRRAIPWLIWADAVCHLLQIAFVGYLSYLGSVSFKRICDVAGPAWNDDAFIWATAGVFWTYCLFSLVLVLMSWGQSSKLKFSNEGWEETYMNSLWVSMMWFGWNPFNKSNRTHHRSRAKRVGANLKSLFGHSDISLTDFVISWMYARYRARHGKMEKLCRRDFRQPCMERGPDQPPYNMSVDWLLQNGLYKETYIEGTCAEFEVLQEAKDAFKYAMAAYGWMMYMLGQGIFPGLWAILWGGKSYYFPVFTGKTNVEIASRVIDATKDQILFLREQGDKDNVLSYIICLDHEHERVIISVRGAVSINDNVRDILLEPAELDGWILSPPSSWQDRPPEIKEASSTSKYLAQGDYLCVSRATLCDILDNRILEETLKLPQHSHYSITFSGHSLGAVACFFLALYFEKFIPNVRCWCFSPPLGLVDKSIAETSSSWCTTIACGKEIVPRFSAASLDCARDQIVFSLAAIRQSKWKLFYHLMWKYKSVCHEDGLLAPIDPDSLSDEVRNYLVDYVQSRNSDRHRRYLVESANRMTVPGKVIYFQPRVTPETRRHSSSNFAFMDVSPPRREYDPIVIDNESMNDQGLIFSGRLLADHMPDYAEEVIKRMGTDTNDELYHKCES